MEQGEERIKQEDCSEDKLGAGILTLTNKRIAFDKTNARIMDFSKRFGETVLDVPLGKVTKTWKEGLLMKKCVLVQQQRKEKRRSSLEFLIQRVGLGQLRKLLVKISNQS